MADNLDPKIVDQRVVQRYLKKGLLDEKDYEQYMKKLPDLAEQAVAVESEIEPADLDEPDQPEKKD